MRRNGAGAGEGFWGISFVIAVQIRLLEGSGCARYVGRRKKCRRAQKSGE
jgi:hypothetical protein